MKFKHPSAITLLLLISFASVNAVLFTPALPTITHYFGITDNAAQQTITGFLIGYALGQLLYGPITHRFGKKKALYIGISLQIVSSLLCVGAGITHTYSLLVLGRFLLALGSGVGLKMTFTLVNEYYQPKLASQKISYLMLGFAVTPGLAIALGGILNAHYGWESCFYASACYGIVLLLLVRNLPSTHDKLQLDAFKLSRLIQGYANQFKNKNLIAGGLLMGGATCFIYLFAAIAPFVAMNLLGMSATNYGIANILPTIGLALGSLSSAQFAKKYNHSVGIRLGILITIISAIFMLVAVFTHQSPFMELFLPMMVIYFGLSFVFANASTVAMSYASDKVQGSAVMNFVNMGLVTVITLAISYSPTTQLLLPIAFIVISIAMMGMFSFLFKEE